MVCRVLFPSDFRTRCHSRHRCIRITNGASTTNFPALTRLRKKRERIYNSKRKHSLNTSKILPQNLNLKKSNLHPTGNSPPSPLTAPKPSPLPLTPPAEHSTRSRSRERACGRRQRRRERTLVPCPSTVSLTIMPPHCQPCNYASL